MSDLISIMATVYVWLEVLDTVFLLPAALTDCFYLAQNEHSKLFEFLQHFCVMAKSS